VILLDTHVLVWLALEPEKLSAPAKAAILNARRTSLMAIASISLWERSPDSISGPPLSALAFASNICE